MIAGIGIDLVDTRRMAGIYGKFGARFLRKCFTSNEYAQLPANPAIFLSGRFAVKEAAVKALGTGFGHGITPLQIETINCAASGRPLLYLHGKALELSKSLGITGFHVSISHERAYAVAVVILEIKEG